MSDQFLEKKIVELGRLKELALMPFPSEDCRRLQSRIGNRKRYQDLIPDLDIYSSWVVGSCSWGRKILEWTPERMRKTLKISAASFFVWFPQYKPLKLQITKRRYPRLYTEFKHLAKMRQVLAELLVCLLSQPNFSQIEVAVPEKMPLSLLQPPLLSRKLRLVHRQARIAHRRRKRVIAPVKFQGPAMRIVHVQPLGENIF